MKGKILKITSLAILSNKQDSLPLTILYFGL